MLLAGDIGGTKVNLALFSAEKGPREALAEATFPSASYKGLSEIVREFLNGVDVEVQSACFGVAGPVVGGRASITNLPWVIDAQELIGSLGLSAVYLLNDLESIANSVPILEVSDLYVLNQGKAEPEAAMAVIAPGTGLGEAFLTWDGGKYLAHPSEGGHTDFGPIDELQIGLLGYLLKRYPHVSYERVCSGLGLPNIYAYLKASGYAEEPDWLAARIAGVTDINPIIVDAAMIGGQTCPLARSALNLFVSILGSEAGNLAVKVLATGGVYLGGGIPPRILPALQGETFMNAFLNKGRFKDLMARMPVCVILNPRSPIMGAARYGLDQQG
ncbi:MAG: glucokinase [Anaerolineae bacterium]|nr:glucokinase [Anaerolineae bacterium]